MTIIAPILFRSRVIENLPKLKHLDLKLITPEERALSSAMFKNPTMEEVLAEGASVDCPVLYLYACLLNIHTPFHLPLPLSHHYRLQLLPTVRCFLIYT